LIPDNIQQADAPVRYPFLWNAPKQDYTQWPGFSPNGDDLLGLARNLGEVYGEFAVFEPTKERFGINYLNNNSAYFDGLRKLEGLIKQIGPPEWPWPVDTKLAEQGKAIYNRPTAQNGCSDCHGIRRGEVRLFTDQTWATPRIDVGTDTREWDILKWQARTGVFKDAPIIPSFPLRFFGDTGNALELLTTSVLGSILQNSFPPAATAMETQAKQLERFQALHNLTGGFHLPGQPSPSSKQAAPTKKNVFEARVLEGIWAAAPYLHNGSVPTLYDLLLPADRRPKAFKIGPAYDKVKVGLAIEQTKFDYTLNTTDCSDRNSGNSRCGHEYGTQLPPDEKKALLEYLKKL